VRADEAQNRVHGDEAVTMLREFEVAGTSDLIWREHLTESR